MTETEGHNGGNDLTPAESKALHMHHFDRIEAQKAVVKAAQDELKRRRKAAKTDRLVMADLDYMARCANLEDPEIAPAEIMRRAEIASWFALPVNFQPDMFDMRLEPLEDRAAREGEAAGFRGMEASPPYDASSGAGQAWLKAWHAGNEKRVEALASALEKVGGGKEDESEIIKGSGSDEPDFPDDAEPAVAAE